jgi:site-specific DNA-methyltransferase (adenine-specific)/modification methylase
MLIIKNKKMLKNEINENKALSIARVMRSVLVHADCFDVFPYIADKSVNLILCDLPYGTTANKWDSLLDLNKLWKEYERILAPKGEYSIVWFIRF